MSIIRKTCVPMMLASVLLILTGCGTQPEKESETIAPVNTEPLTEAVQTSQSQPPQTNSETSSSIVLNVVSDDESFSFELDSSEGYFERFNPYTDELKYSFRIDEISVDVEPRYSAGTYTMTLSFSGEKLYDCLGEDAVRGISLPIKLKDSSGVVIDSTNTASLIPAGFKTGDKLEGLSADFPLLELEPGQYTIDIHAQPDSYVEFPAENTEFLRPDKWYISAVINNFLETGAEFPFDTSAEWISEYAMHEMYVDDDLMLYGVFSEPFDLHEAVRSASASDPPSLTADFQYGSTDYYDILNPVNLLNGVPEEAMPDSVRVSVSPQGNIVFGERATVFVSFGYKHQPGDEYNYVALCFESHLGKSLTQQDWERVLNRAEELGIDFSELAS